MKGKNLILYEKYQKVYCDDELSSNLIVPFVDYDFNELKKQIYKRFNNN